MRQGFRHVVHFFGDHQAVIGEGIEVGAQFPVHLAENGEACSRFTADVRPDFAEANHSRGGASAVCRRWGTIYRKIVLIFRAPPPTVIGVLGADRKGHVVDDALCADERTEDKVGSVLCFAENIRNTVDAACRVVEFVMVHVCIRICRGHDGGSHECIHLGLRFFQVVAAVVVSALECSCEGGVVGISNFYFVCDCDSAGAIFRVAGWVEPRIAIAAAVDSVELDGSVLYHGINQVGYNECA